MSSDPRDIERLKAIAYGRTATPAEKQAAADALHALHQATTPAAAADPHVTPEALADTAPSGGDGTNEVAASPVPARRFWIAAAIGMAACLVIGFGVATVTQTSSVGPAPTATPTPVEAEEFDRSFAHARPGDSEQAERLFEREQVEADLAIEGSIIEGMQLDPATVRALAWAPDLRVFVARSAEGDYCLLIESPATGGAAGSCTSPEDFDVSALQISGEGTRGSWDGRELYLDLPSRSAPFSLP